MSLLLYPNTSRTLFTPKFMFNPRHDEVKSKQKTAPDTFIVIKLKELVGFSSHWVRLNRNVTKERKTTLHYTTGPTAASLKTIFLNFFVRSCQFFSISCSCHAHVLAI